MNPYTLLRMMWATAIGLLFIAGGIMAYRVKEEWGYPGIGFRIGYTYLSKRAWREANRFSGAALTLLGVTIIALSPFLTMLRLMVVMLAGISVVLLLSYIIARRAYELDEMGQPTPEMPGAPKPGGHLAYQLALIASLIFLAVHRGKLPEVAFLAGIMTFLLFLTALFTRPLVFQLAPGFKGKMAGGFAPALSTISTLLFLFGIIEALNASLSPLWGVALTFISLAVIFWAVFKSLVSAYEEGYY
ncbi:SdpI family protein [Thermococcus sp.]